MMANQRTDLTFRCADFNTTEDKDYFINPGNYGDDLMRWLMQALRDRGYVIESEDDPLGQEDHGWFFNFIAGGVSHTFLIQLHGDYEDSWHGWLERNVGCLASLIGGRGRGILPEASDAIYETLAVSERIHDLKWE
ncbi:MAG TPA: hypothetical protein VFW40_08060 [Capsulimonadaceae bacterium]|nr:hypothetical protein [Capsulimonadaceae bacterium]